MKKLVLTFGLIAGGIITGPMLVSMAFIHDVSNYNTSMFIGYATMIIGFSAIFFGIRSYRDKELGGSISFGKAFQIGLLISLVATVVYVTGWMIYYHTSSTDIVDKIAQNYAEKIKHSGKSAAEISKELLESKQMMESYKNNPLVMIMYTIMEILPVGLIITLICALILRRKKPLVIQ